MAGLLVVSDLCGEGSGALTEGVGDPLPKSAVAASGGRPAMMRPLFSWFGRRWGVCVAGLLTLTCEYFWKVLFWSYCWCSSLNIPQHLVWVLVQEWAFLVFEDRSSA